MKSNDKIRNSLNENLSGLYVSRQQHAALMNDITGGKKVKKKMTTGLILAMALVLLAAVALAWGLTYSPDVATTKVAREAVMKQYGLSQKAMDMLWAKVDRTGGETTVSFAPFEELVDLAEKAGVYTAVVSKNGNVVASWSHDDVDPALWADGSLDAPAWGNEQILKYRAQRDAKNRADGAAADAGTSELENQDWDSDTPKVTPTPMPSMEATDATAVAAANAAMIQSFGFTEETLMLFETVASRGDTEAEALAAAKESMREDLSIDKFAPYADEFKPLLNAYPPLSGKEGAVWVVCYQPSPAVNQILYAKGYSPLGVYVMSFLEETGEVLHKAWSLEGKETGTYTPQTWGQADAYDASMLPWVLDFLKICWPIEEAAEAEQLSGSWSVEEKAAFDQTFRDAGFDKAQYNHVLPTEKDIPYEKAVEIVAQVLEEECGVSREVFDASVFAYADLTQEPERREWYFWVQNAEEQCGWTVELNAETGEIYKVLSDPFANGNG